MLDPNRLVYDHEEDPTEPVAPERIAKWERTVGGAMPGSLRALYELGDGGRLRDTSIDVTPMDDVQTLEPAYLEDVDEHDAASGASADPARIVQFGYDSSNGGMLLLNYNGVGPGGEPTVYSVYSEPDSLRRIADTLDAFLEAELDFEKAPCVDWSEADGPHEVLARVTLDVSHMHGSSAAWHQVLIRAVDALVLLVREDSPGGERLERTQLPTPLDASGSSLRRYWEEPETYALMIRPAESSGIIHREAVKTSDGTWRNTESEGVPVYVQVLSPSRDELAALRERLVGADEAAKLEAADREQERLAALPPAERMTALLQRMVEFQEELKSFLPDRDEPDEEHAV
ncbi:SMI1/KNR4 family protein [Paludisphaera mucosa]|uniref:SMI1/KNR4 family protein n=1 Tax=Paludisphaera mucosa TaxID=3030827 RepID=A0ABT6FET3_9BACT|nr:SMI1/KNR4 family protein [Paludisphaera mucosa]MDG3006032.1 SMI1/KNR4 family protein [Paludisphaera mucosa]